MANTTPIFPGTIRSQLSSITPSDGTNLKTIFTAGSNGSRVDSIWVWNDTSANVTLMFYQGDGTNNYILGSTTISTKSGVELLTNIMSDVVDRCDSKYLSSNHVLKAKVSSAISSDSITIVVDGGDY